VNEQRSDSERFVAGVIRGAQSLVVLKIALPLLAALLGLILLLGLAVSAAPSSGVQQICTGQGKTADIPPEYIPWLEQAAAKWRLGPRGFSILAGVHRVETDFKRSKLPGVSSGTNSAGAAGPGQFLAPSWAQYGQDADGDGAKEIYSIPDSVFATAAYLRASGAPEDWRGAIFAYNHAGWYVDEVLAAAESYQGDFSCKLIGSPVGTVPLGAIDWNDTSGAWGGSQKFAELAARIGKRHGCTVVSAKRSTQTTTSGNNSDHWTGSKHSYAVDLDACDLHFPGGAADQTARDIQAAFDLPGHTGVITTIRGRYRIQLLWQTYVGGDHYNHVHVGIRNLCCPSG
jgi:hypothetical protein